MKIIVDCEYNGFPIKITYISAWDKNMILKYLEINSMSIIVS